MSRRDLMLKIVLPVLILLIGLGLTVALIKTRKAPHTEEQTFAGFDQPELDTLQTLLDRVLKNLTPEESR